MTGVHRFTGAPARDAALLRRLLSESDDVTVKPLRVGGRDAAGVFLETMCSEARIIRAVTAPLTDQAAFSRRAPLPEQIRRTAYKGAELSETTDPLEAAEKLAAGHFALLLAEETSAFLFGAQGFPKMQVDSAQSEQNEFGGREGFTDTLKDNEALLRRRLGATGLKLKRLRVGKTAPANVTVCYLPDRADPAAVEKIERRLRNGGADLVFGAGWLRPLLNGRFSLFPATAATERPDVLACRLCEGRVGILTDGAPFALIAPCLFTDHFQAPDDYLTGAVYAGFVRVLRLLCFFTAVFLPGVFVAVCDFHPNMLPPDVMFKIAAAEAQTPFPLALEAAAIHLIYEAVREAGLRMPRAAGHTVSIVGALVIGDAAVTAGLIAAPMLIVAGLTTVCTAVVSGLQDRVALLRLLFIAAGGAAGLFGVFLGLGLVTLEICAAVPFGVPLSAPASPYSGALFADGLFRRRLSALLKNRASVKEMRA